MYNVHVTVGIRYCEHTMEGGISEDCCPDRTNCLRHLANGILDGQSYGSLYFRAISSSVVKSLHSIITTFSVLQVPFGTE